MSDHLTRQDVITAWKYLDLQDVTVAVINDPQMQTALRKLADAIATAQQVKAIARQRHVIEKAQRMIADAEEKMQELAGGHTPTD